MASKNISCLSLSAGVVWCLCIELNRERIQQAIYKEIECIYVCLQRAFYYFKQKQNEKSKHKYNLTPWSRRWKEKIDFLLCDFNLIFELPSVFFSISPEITIISSLNGTNENTRFRSSSLIAHNFFDVLFTFEHLSVLRPVFKLSDNDQIVDKRRGIKKTHSIKEYHKMT